MVWVAHEIAHLCNGDSLPVWQAMRAGSATLLVAYFGAG